jgi:hypothetical protein
MKRSSRSTRIPTLFGWTTALCFAFFAAPALADNLDDSSPAAIRNSGNDQARTQLKSFAKNWIAKMRSVETQNRKNPKIRPGASASVTSYRGFGDDYTVEVRPTGRPTAPYIGILRYSEQVYTCRDSNASKCSVSASSPVTEIFRYKAGQWVY